MKTKMLTLATVVLMASSAYAQEQKNEGFNPASAPKTPPTEEERMERNKAKMQSQKIAFLTKELELTPEEAEKFWPIYNERDSREQGIKQMSKSLKKQLKEKGKEAEITDEEAEKLIQAEFSERQKVLDLDREYDAKYKKVLPLKKVAKLYLAEDKFNREMLGRMKGEQGPPQRPTPTGGQMPPKDGKGNKGGSDSKPSGF